MGEAGSRASPPPASGSLAPASSSGILPQRSPHASHLLDLFAMLGGGHAGGPNGLGLGKASRDIIDRVAD